MRKAHKLLALIGKGRKKSHRKGGRKATRRKV